MADTRIIEALRTVVDPCCAERGISVVDMGIVRDAALTDGDASVELLLTSGWCPFQTDLVATITDVVEQLPGVDRAAVRIVLDEAWSTTRLSESARTALRFLPEPSAVGDRERYVAAHALPVLSTRPERPRDDR